MRIEVRQGGHSENDSFSLKTAGCFNVKRPTHYNDVTHLKWLHSPRVITVFMYHIWFPWSPKYPVGRNALTLLHAVQELEEPQVDSGLGIGGQRGGKLHHLAPALQKHLAGEEMPGKAAPWLKQQDVLSGGSEQYICSDSEGRRGL